jgi:hypothetical protein
LSYIVTITLYTLALAPTAWSSSLQTYTSKHEGRGNEGLGTHIELFKRLRMKEIPKTGMELNVEAGTDDSQERAEYEGRKVGKPRTSLPMSVVTEAT